MANQVNPQNLKPDEYFAQQWAHLANGLNKNLTAFATHQGMTAKEWWTYHECVSPLYFSITHLVCQCLLPHVHFSR
jgi:hypothetical protein